MREAVRDLYIGITGSRAASVMARRATAGRLRVLAYHDVANAAAFRAQMGELARCYEPVTLSDVLAAAHGGSHLPSSAVLVTFDDGHRGVIDHALPVLDEYGITATLFVCPGVIEGRQAFWWEIVRNALALGLQPSFGGRRWADEALVSTLKTQPDAVRRSFVSRLAGDLQRRGLVPQSSVAGRDELALWVSRGHAVGNHTWDHPCLDRCSPAAQREQLEKADEWLRLNLPGYEPVFAYPNGNWSGATEAILGSLGYQAAFGFDHRLTRTRSPLGLSRLRVSADVPLPRFRSIVSGLHALPFTLLGDRSSGADARDLARVPS